MNLPAIYRKAARRFEADGDVAFVVMPRDAYGLWCAFSPELDGKGSYSAKAIVLGLLLLAEILETA